MLYFSSRFAEVFLSASRILSLTLFDVLLSLEFGF